MKKFIALVLCVMMALSMVVTASAEAAEGTFEGTAAGRNGDITVAVTFEAGAIKDVAVRSHNETAGISDPAIAKIPAAIVENQSVAVEPVTGATMTSNGIIEAVKAAIVAAGAAVEDYSAVKETVAGEAVTVEADVIVIGAGGAGMAAAMRAAQAGASVAVIEKTAAAGGNTIVSGGYLNAVDPVRAAKMEPADVSMYYALCEKEPQNERHAYWQGELKAALDEYFAGPQDHLFDCIALHVLQTYDGGDYVADIELVENVVTKAPAAVEWLESMGMQYDNDALYTVTGGLWARGHKALKPNGTGYFEVFFDQIEKQGLDINIYYETRATHFITEDGKVTGVEAEASDGTPYTFKAGRNVVLATGGFGANVEMRQYYNTHWASLDETVNSSEVASETGDGITMALELGAQLVGMEWIQLHPLIAPAGKNAVCVCQDTERYIQLNWEGNRYVAEDARRDELSQAGLLQTDGEMWQITDVSGIFAAVDSYVDAGYCYKADTLEELAEKIGVPADALVASVEQYNHAVETGVDEAFGRTLLKYKIETAPFYAGLCKPGVHHTMGGVKIDTECRVYTEAGETIPGLYAAGEVTGGIHGSNRVGGNAIADIFVNGQTAGINAAKVEAEVLTADVVVAGAGGAGLSAAVAAAENGASVIVLEKTATACGATGLSAGAIASAAREGDTEGTYNEDQLYDFWMEIADGKTNADVTRKIADMSVDSINWLADMGIEWKRAMTGYFGKDILLVAGELGEGGKLGSAGMMIINALVNKAESLGVSFLYETPATGILLDENGKVCGISATKADGSVVEVYAKSVVLATGDYIGDYDKMASIRPDVDMVTLFGHMLNTGDGINMAVAVGAKESYGDEVAKGCYGTVAANFGTYEIGLVVNDKAERFMNESIGYGPYYTNLRNQIREGVQVFWEIFDSNCPYLDDCEECTAAGTMVKADTIEELAVLMGVDPEKLAATCAAYDALGTEDTQFGKLPEFMFGMSKGPFYATMVYPLALGSYGGLEMDTDAHILKADGTVFENLFGAGDIVLRSFMVDTYPYSGSCIQYAISGGRIAGENAAKLAK